MFRRPRDIPLGRLCSEHAARLCDELGWQIARVSVLDEREGWSVVDEHVRGGDPASTRAALAHSTSAAGLRERVREAEDVVLLGSVDDLSGVRAALAIPIHGADGAIVAALELYSATPFADAAVIAAMGRFVAWQIEEFAAAVHEHKRGQERFRALLEAAPDAMVIIDGSGTILLVNSQTEALFGLPRAELVGQTVEVLIPEHFRGSHPIDSTTSPDPPRGRWARGSPSRAGGPTAGNSRSRSA